MPETLRSHRPTNSFIPETPAVMMTTEPPKFEKSGTPGVSFIAENADVIYLLLGILVALIAYLLAEREKRRNDSFDKSVTALHELLNESMTKVVTTVDRLDAKMELTLTEAFRRIGSLESELSHLRGEHDTRKQLCSMVSNWSRKQD